MLRVESSNSASPNEYTFSAVIAACPNIERAYLGEQLHAQAARRGLSHSHARSVVNSLVKLYARCGRLSAADAIFRESSVKDVVSWSTIISGYAQEGLAEESFALFSEIPVLVEIHAVHVGSFLELLRSFIIQLINFELYYMIHF